MKTPLNRCALRPAPAVLCAAACWMYGCARLPSDDGLARNFSAQRSGFEDLVAMFSADSTFRRIDAGGYVTPRGMSDARYGRYVEIFRRLQVANGINREPGYPQAVFIIAESEVPIGGKSYAVGLAHSPLAVGPVLRRLPTPPLPIEWRSGSGQEILFQRLDDGWYLFHWSAW